MFGTHRNVRLGIPQKSTLGDLPRETTDLALLAKAGDDGWEFIVIIINNMAYLKRPIGKQRSKQRT